MMKRMISLILCAAVLLSVMGCTALPEESTVPTEQSGFQTDTVDFPQTGRYRETALLANIPGQATPLLLDVRQDGSVDYLYTEHTDRADLQALSGGWMAQLDAYTEEVSRTAALPNGRWRYLFAADEGSLLILAQYHDILTPVGSDGNREPSGEIRHSALFRVDGGVLCKVPMSWEAEIGGSIYAIDTRYVDSITFEDGIISLELYSAQYLSRHNWIVQYGSDGTVLDARSLPTAEVPLFEYHTKVDDDGLVLWSTREPNQALTEASIAGSGRWKTDCWCATVSNLKGPSSRRLPRYGLSSISR